MRFTVIDKKNGKEADTYTIALKEDWAKGLIYCDIEGFAITEDGTLVLMDECGNVAYCPDNRFEIVFDEKEENCRIYGKEVVEQFEKPECKKCAEEHEQLAEWLKELKAYKDSRNEM